MLHILYYWLERFVKPSLHSNEGFLSSTEVQTELICEFHPTLNIILHPPQSLIRPVPKGKLLLYAYLDVSLPVQNVLLSVHFSLHALFLE